MKSSKFFLTVALATSLAMACSNPPPAPTPDASDDASSSQPDATSQPDASEQPDASAQPDATSQPDVAAQPDVASLPDATSSGDACTPPIGLPPTLMGPGACSTLEFGQPAAAAMTVPEAITFRGGMIPPGIYDAIAYSRTVGSTNSSYRATLVVGADLRYTEVRQLSTNVMSPGPVTRRSGTLMPMATTLARTVTCTDGDAGMDTMTGPYSVENRCDGVYLHYGTANLWFTYRRRQ